MPRARQLRKTRSAISPLFATRSRAIGTGPLYAAGTGTAWYRLGGVIRLLVRTAITLAGSAIGLIVAALLLDGVDINVASFVVAVAIFTVVYAILQPFLAVQLRRLAPQAVGGVALVATLVALIITDLVSDGFSISGIGAWIAATVIVWVVSLLAVLILPVLRPLAPADARGARRQAPRPRPPPRTARRASHARSPSSGSG